MNSSHREEAVAQAVQHDHRSHDHDITSGDFVAPSHLVPEVDVHLTHICLDLQPGVDAQHLRLLQHRASFSRYFANFGHKCKFWYP